MLALLLAVHVRLLAFNDFHGQLGPGKMLEGRPAGSAAVFASWLQRYEDKDTFIVHAGDLVGASPPDSSLLGDVPTIEFMNLVCKPVRCVGTAGNHEFDRGTDALVRLLRGAHYPTVLANVVDVAKDKPLFKPWVIEEINGVHVAFIGAVLRDAATIVTPSAIKGLRFLDEPEAVNRAVKEVREHGAQAVVLLIHQGGTQQPGGPLEGKEIDDVLSRLEGVDVVVTGHAHAFTNTTVRGMLVTQSYSSGVAFAAIDLEVDEHGVVLSRARTVKAFADEVKPDPQVERLVQQADAQVAHLVNRVVGTASAEISSRQNDAGESELGQIIADAQRASTKTQIAFLNPGGVRGDLHAGKLTWGDLFSVQPFGNELVVLELTGAQVLRVLEQQWAGQPFQRILKPSGLRFSWTSDHRVHDVTVGDEPLDVAKTYTVTVNSFLAAGGDRFSALTEGKRVTVAGHDLDAFAAYVRTLPQPFSVHLDGRIQRR